MGFGALRQARGSTHGSVVLSQDVVLSRRVLKTHTDGSSRAAAKLRLPTRLFYRSAHRCERKAYSSSLSYALGIAAIKEQYSQWCCALAARRRGGFSKPICPPRPPQSKGDIVMPSGVCLEAVLRVDALYVTIVCFACGVGGADVVASPP